MFETQDVFSLKNRLRPEPLLLSVGQTLAAGSADMESKRKKVGGVRQENACLSMQDEQLLSDLDALQSELTSSKSQLNLRGPRAAVDGSAAVMSVQIRQLEAELEAQAKDLKDAQLRAECSQEAAAHNDIVVASLSEELSALRGELDHKTALGKRAEQQRNQALENAEKLKEAFKEYKATISLKLKKVMESESRLKQSLIECDREKEEVEKKSAVLQREVAEQGQTISQLKEELREAKRSAAERSDLQTQLEEARRRVSNLDRQLAAQGAECREQASLLRELQELRTLTQSQEQRVAQSQAELSSLEAALALLHLREGAVGALCIKPCMLPPVDYSGTVHLLKLKPGEGYQQLLRVLQSSEFERTKLNSLVERLQDRLSRAQEEVASLQSSMAQRASHYQSLHTELLDKVSQATDTEKELKRKCARVAALEKQLQEKTAAYSQAALKNTELENQLLEKTRSVQQYQTLVTKKQREYQQSLDQCKRSQSQQCTEQQHRIEMLQLSAEETRSRLLELEQELCLRQRERDDAQKAALLLQTTVEQLTQEKQVGARNREELLQSFKEQAAQSAKEVGELQSSLSACRDEAASCLQQMLDVKTNYEDLLRKSNDKVSALQEQLHGTSLVCQRSSEQNLQLQLSLQQQQTMLTESTTRISDLEESQCQLQRQVSSLEQQLERARASLQEEVRTKRQDNQEREKDLEEMNQQNTKLSESVTHVTSEIVKCRGELVSKESELQRLRKDVTIKAIQIGRMDETLQQAKNKLSSKSDQVVDLEEKLHRCEADQLNSVQRILTLEGQLQSVRGELADTLEQLLKLKDILQFTQSVADERQESVDKLTVQLSETQRELEARTHEVLDMDNALKERQGELQQRAQLLGQLDVAIREHKQEMERKVESMQRNLDARERELKEAQRQLTDRNTKDSQELGQQLHVCQQKLQTLRQDLEESRLECESVARQLDATKLQSEEKEVRLCGVEEELALKEARWLQAEARLQSTVTSLERELELERVQHSKELDSLQQTRGQLLKVSEQISSTMRSSQEQLAAKLHQSQTQLDQTKALLDQTKTVLQQTQNQVSHLQTQLDQSQSQLLQNKAQMEQSQILYEQSRIQNSDLRAQLEMVSAQLNQTRVQVAQLQAQLHVFESSMETSNETMLIKESEVTRLQARISSLERAADRQNHYNHTLAVPIVTPSHSSSAHSPPQRTQSTPPCSPTHKQSCTPPPTHAHLQPASASHLSETHDWLQSRSIDSSLDLPLSLKATLREALSKQPWEATSSCSSVSPFPNEAHHSWQGLSTVDATATSDLSFNPLTYMVDKQDDRSFGVEAVSLQEGGGEWSGESRRESVCTLVGEEEPDMSSLTGMLRFVNQTLAKQDDPSLWSSSGISHS